METELFYKFLLEEHKSEPNKKKFRKVFLNSLNKKIEILKNLPENLEDCAICLDKLNKISTTKTKCGHYFHYYCLKFWRNVSKNITKTCPLCRFDLLIPSTATFYWDIKSSNEKETNIPQNTHLDFKKKDNEDNSVEFCFKIIVSGGMGSKGKAEYKVVY